MRAQNQIFIVVQIKCIYFIIQVDVNVLGGKLKLKMVPKLDSEIKI
jgi:hypothetical protein